jgi:hypothetical protein
MNQDKELKVYVSNRESTCNECGKTLGHEDLIALTKDRCLLCLACADFDHLFFLRSGNTALTRRARKHSTLAAVVLKWSSARKRNERQGVLVEMRALEQAEEECLADSEVRAQRREREAVRKDVLDHQYVEQFAKRVRELFPGCPAGTEREIAEHACEKFSGRIGRSASAKNLDEAALCLAVIAHIRHTKTNYDELLMEGHARDVARALVQDAIDDVLKRWEACRTPD